MSNIINLFKDTQNVGTDYEAVEYMFPSHEVLLGEIMKQKDLGDALELINKINALNGYEVISKYDTVLIEKHYKDEQERIKERYKDLQKGYMKMFAK